MKIAYETLFAISNYTAQSIVSTLQPFPITMGKVHNHICKLIQQIQDFWWHIVMIDKVFVT